MNCSRCAQSSAKMIAYQPPTRAIKQRTALLTNSRELIALDRELARGERSFRDNPYKYTYLYLPLSQIVGVDVLSNPRNQAVNKIVIKTRHHAFSVPYDAQNVGFSALFVRLSRRRVLR